MAFHTRHDHGRGVDGTGLLGPDGLRYQHAEIATEAASRAALFGERHRRGMRPHIGVLLGNSDEFVFWLSAAALAGAALVGVNPTRRGAELARGVRHAECELLVTSRAPSVGGDAVWEARNRPARKAERSAATAPLRAAPPEA